MNIFIAGRGVLEDRELILVVVEGGGMSFTVLTDHDLKVGKVVFGGNAAAVISVPLSAIFGWF